MLWTRGVERVDAAREVLLSAGAIGSPHLLQLSGVGKPEMLQKAGIAVRHALPGVGQNFQDHYIARMSCYVRNLETLNERARGLGFANEIMRYLAEDADRRAMVGGLKFLRRLFAAPSLAKYVVAEKMPGPGVQSDDKLLDYARQNGSTVYHASCSCMMGTTR